MQGKRRRPLLVVSTDCIQPSTSAANIILSDLSALLLLLVGLTVIVTDHIRAEWTGHGGNRWSNALANSYETYSRRLHTKFANTVLCSFVPHRQATRSQAVAGIADRASLQVISDCC